MKVVEVDYSDVVGKQFNGYNLHVALLEKGVDAQQVVLHKKSRLPSVIPIEHDLVLEQQINIYEEQNSIKNILQPFSVPFLEMEQIKTADIIHYHLIHKGVFSLLDYSRLMANRHSVWTIHDPWIFTGNCLHPNECKKWKTGCQQCERLNDYFSMSLDNTAFMWKIKKEALSNINPYTIVSTNYMKKFLNESMMTKHFDKIRVIPFGVKIEEDCYIKREQSHQRFGIKENEKVIGFRADDMAIKGCSYIYKALLELKYEKIVLCCVGEGKIPEAICKKYRLIRLGWVEDEKLMRTFFSVLDVFLMPSLAESFGMMCIEAMAAGCPVICFKGTVLEEVAEAPECGVAVDYKSSGALCTAIEKLLRDDQERIVRGRLGRKIVEERYSFDRYVNEHLKLYNEIMLEEKNDR